MFDTIFNIIYEIVSSFAYFVDGIFLEIGEWDQYNFNIYLFSDKGWFSTPISLNNLLSLIAGIFMFIFIIRLLWKATKKFINVVFGVIKL